MFDYFLKIDTMQNKKKEFDIEFLYVLNLKKFNIITKVLHLIFLKC